MDKVSLSSIANTLPSRIASPGFIKNCRRTESIQAYHKASMNILKQSNSHKLKTVNAISKWLTSGNVRLIFYSSDKKGDIRVRIVPNDSSEIIRDLSLDEFLNMAPVCAQE